MSTQRKPRISAVTRALALKLLKESGVEALAILESGEQFDLVLSDLMMAEMDGIALLERSKERYPEMPVVMVTAVHDISVALQALRNLFLARLELVGLGRWHVVRKANGHFDVEQHGGPQAVTATGCDARSRR